MRGLMNIATIGEFHGDNMKMKVFVSESDLKVVHVCDSKTIGDNFHTCVRLDEPAYSYCEQASSRFSFGDVLSFIRFMKSNYDGPMTFRKCGIRTKWDYTIFQWNSENPYNNLEMREGDDGFVITIPMPDYTKLR